MDKNMKLAIGFRGDLNLTAQAVPLQEGYLKIGGIVDSSADKGLKFGVVVSATPADVSIHTPMRERPNLNSTAHGATSFNSRSREGATSSATGCKRCFLGFNSRSREGAT